MQLGSDGGARFSRANQAMTTDHRQFGDFRTADLFIWLAAIVLFFLHQDFWFWSDTTLVFGFLPIGLAYHAVYSIAAGCLWACAVKFAWPKTIENQANGDDDEVSNS